MDVGATTQFALNELLLARHDAVAAQVRAYFGHPPTQDELDWFAENFELQYKPAELETDTSDPYSHVVVMKATERFRLVPKGWAGDWD